MVCSLCQLEKRPKKNTHYLTDSIIRSSLNEGGINESEKGFYFVIDPDTVYTEMKFQRGATIKIYFIQQFFLMMNEKRLFVDLQHQ